ncbi:Uu.00g014150.m01.CDS01 [Anthostomella pinea]|uniref:Uu.00g014150.m01.CDS01 n=1 Tax=Anthostomella pinea TaxID=933095 RepID=A0AAI8YQE6_9PEZI|nr:Uu.00g014150.m01.CDS01 [Anthostomella pinea]
MYTPTTLTSLFTLIPLALALPLEQRDTQVFNITLLSATVPEGGPYGSGPIDSHISVSLAYEDATGAAQSTTCSYDWPASIAPGPTDWTACADDTMTWRLPADGWTSTADYLVEFYKQTTLEGAGLDASHYLTMNPGQTSDPNAYLSCLQMGKTAPLTCELDGPLSAQTGPVVMSASEETARAE